MRYQMTFRGYMVITHPYDMPCGYCGTKTPSELRCLCGTTFCMIKCVPVKCWKDGDIECPKCVLETAINAADLAYIAAEREWEENKRERIAELQMERLRMRTADDVIRQQPRWQWTRINGDTLAKLTVKPEEVLKHVPSAGTILIVHSPEGATSFQVTTGGHARRNGDKIDLIAEVEKYEPYGKHQDINRSNLQRIHSEAVR